MSTTHTDIQLKQTLVKMLPEVVIHTANKQHEFGQLNWMGRPELVLDTELLHLCWLAEEEINDFDKEIQYARELYALMCGTMISDMPASLSGCYLMLRATWQQRVIALAKVKGIEIA